MNVTEAVQEGLNALVLPELKALATEIAAVRLEQARQAGQLDATNHRLADMHDSLVLNTQRQDVLAQKNDELRKDMGALRTHVETGLADVRQEMGTLRTHIDTGLADVRQELHAGLGDLRKDMDARFQEQRRESDARFDRLHGRIDSLIQVMVKPEEFGALRTRVERVEGRVRHLRRASGQ